METTIFGHGQFFSPHMVTVRYQEKNGSQHNKKAPITIRKRTKLLIIINFKLLL